MAPLDGGRAVISPHHNHSHDCIWSIPTGTVLVHMEHPSIGTGNDERRLLFIVTARRHRHRRARRDVLRPDRGHNDPEVRHRRAPADHGLAHVVLGPAAGNENCTGLAQIVAQL